jgi:hypothetical protein
LVKGTEFSSFRGMKPAWNNHVRRLIEVFEGQGQRVPNLKERFGGTDGNVLNPSKLKGRTSTFHLWPSLNRREHEAIQITFPKIRIDDAKKLPLNTIEEYQKSLNLRPIPLINFTQPHLDEQTEQQTKEIVNHVDKKILLGFVQYAHHQVSMKER